MKPHRHRYKIPLRMSSAELDRLMAEERDSNPKLYAKLVKWRMDAMKKKGKKQSREDVGHRRKQPA